MTTNMSKLKYVITMGILLILLSPTIVNACDPWDSDIHGLRDRVERLECLVRNLHCDCPDYQSQIDSLQSQINDLYSQLDAIIDANSVIFNSFDDRITILEQEYQSVSQLFITVNQIQQDVTEIQTTIENLPTTTIINKYYETHNYDPEIKLLTQRIGNLTARINYVDLVTGQADYYMIETITKLQDSLRILELKVDGNNINALNAISVLRSEIMAQLQNIDLYHTNNEIDLQAQIESLKSNVYDQSVTIKFMLTEESSLRTRADNLESINTVQNVALVMFGFIILLLTIYIVNDSAKRNDQNLLNRYGINKLQTELDELKKGQT